MIYSLDQSWYKMNQDLLYMNKHLSVVKPWNLFYAIIFCYTVRVQVFEEKILTIHYLNQRHSAIFFGYATSLSHWVNLSSRLQMLNTNIQCCKPREISKEKKVSLKCHLNNFTDMYQVRGYVLKQHSVQSNSLLDYGFILLLFK